MNYVIPADKVMPSLKDVTTILTAKFSYDQAKATKTTAEFDTWINDKTRFFKCSPRGIAYSVSKKSYDYYVQRCKANGWKTPKQCPEEALKYFVVAVAVGWDELVQEIKKECSGSIATTPKKGRQYGVVFQPVHQNTLY